MFFSPPMNQSRQRGADRKLTPEEAAANLSVGVVLHDNRNTLQEGWAFRVGQPPFRVRGLVDLPNDSLWISSGEFGDFQKLQGAQFHHVRRSDFLGLKISDLATDLGLRIDGGYAQEGGKRLVNFVQEAVRMVVKAYGITDTTRQLQQDRLVAAIAKLLPPPPPAREMFTARLASAYQSLSIRRVGYIDNSVPLKLRFSRLYYAQWLLSNPVPDNGWSHIFSSQGFDHDKVMSGEFPPTLIHGQLEFDKVSVETAELIAFGAGGQLRARSKRNWMTDVEYRWISRHARVHVQEYMVSTGLVPLPSACALPAILSDSESISHLVSSGILAYAHWQALVSPRWSKLSGVTEHDAIGTWLRAYDRAKCFEAALVLQQQGFHVSAYGNGAVHVQVDRGRLPELAETAGALGIAFPTWNALLQEFGYECPDDPH